MQEYPNSVRICSCNKTENLKERGIYVQRWRIRDSLSKQDGIERAGETWNLVTQSTFNVLGPNHLWHTDSNHKLIQWRFVMTVVALMAIAGSLFVWNAVTTINEVLEYFEHGCKSLVFPTGFAVTRVWTMFKFRDIWSQSGGSFVADRSIHNQQIARLWTEVNRVGSTLQGDPFSFSFLRAVLR